MSDKNPWQTLFARIDTGMDDYRRFIPSKQDISAFEAEFGVPLPESYKSFIQLFGPGILSDEFLVYAPGCPDSNDNLDKHNAGYRKGFARTHKNQPLPRFEHLMSFVWFSTTLTVGTSFGWCPSDVADPKKHEYAVYLMERHDYEPRLAARSFESFVNDLCLGDLYSTMYGKTRSLEVNVFSPSRVRGYRIKKK